jgi:tetratricopeptide (TPR) repeat protein
MINCPCGFGENLGDDQKNCPACGTDLTPLHLLNKLPEFYYKKGMILLEKGQIDEATKMLMTCITLNYSSPAPFVALGDIFKQRELYDEAIKHYERALEINPNDEKIARKKEEAEKLKSYKASSQSKQYLQVTLLKKLAITGTAILFLMLIVIVILLKRLENQHRKYLDLLNKSQITLTEKRSFEFSYTVKKGDNLSSIAYKFYGDKSMWIKIYEANKSKIKDPDKIYQGQILSIPILQGKD